MVKAYNLALVADNYRAKESSATRTLDTFMIISIYSEKGAFPVCPQRTKDVWETQGRP
jgi:hypothetical protein